MKKAVLFLMVSMSLLYKAQITFYFDNKLNQKDSIVIITEMDLYKNIKPLKKIRNKFSTDDKTLNSFENQMKYLAVKCKEIGGNALYIERIVDMSFNQLGMAASVYNLPENSFPYNLRKENAETEFILYRPKYYSGLMTFFKTTEIFIDGENLDFNKGDIFRKKLNKSNVLIEIPKYHYTKTVEITPDKINYMKLMLVQRDEFTGGNQIVVSFGNEIAVLGLVDETQAKVEMAYMAKK
ncbi:hypothetical protein [Elizabethkingia meningoseptica]|uniref:hypothetical protein n=1 Tax=Elizabethkingia meningoseptica TaxID=238 RepID=UPI00389206EA